MAPMKGIDGHIAPCNHFAPAQDACLSFEFPCSICINRIHFNTEDPCRLCDHNVNTDDDFLKDGKYVAHKQ